MKIAEPRDFASASSDANEPVPTSSICPAMPHESHQTIEALPILPRTDTGVWGACRDARDAIYTTISELCSIDHIKPLVLKSDDLEFPAWIKLEFWLRTKDALLTERTSALFTIFPKAFHNFQLEYSLLLNNRGQATTIERLYDVRQEDIAAVVRYLICNGPRPHFRHVLIQRYTWQFWMPRNKLVAIDTNWPHFLVHGLYVLGFFTLGFGIGLLFFGVAGLLQYRLSKRPVFVRTAGKPDGEPRRLRRVDSWQAVISGLGDEFQTLRDRLIDALDCLQSDAIHHRLERIWNWGLDGVVEREQISVTLGRGIVFCKIYQYDQALYVGWDGHVNIGQWVEKQLARGIDVSTGKLVELKDVVSANQTITEYDITDLSCLMELVHTKLVEALKEMMADRKIEQEVDFKVLRGERQGLTGQSNDGSKLTSFFRTFTRTH